MHFAWTNQWFLLTLKYSFISMIWDTFWLCYTFRRGNGKNQNCNSMSWNRLVFTLLVALSLTKSQDDKQCWMHLSSTITLLSPVKPELLLASSQSMQSSSLRGQQQLSFAQGALCIDISSGRFHHKFALCIKIWSGRYHHKFTSCIKIWSGRFHHKFALCIKIWSGRYHHKFTLCIKIWSGRFHCKFTLCINIWSGMFHRKFALCIKIWSGGFHHQCTLCKNIWSGRFHCKFTLCINISSSIGFMWRRPPQTMCLLHKPVLMAPVSLGHLSS